MSCVATPRTAPFARLLNIFDDILIIRDDSFFHLALDSFTTILKNLRTDAIVDLEIHSRLSTVFGLLTLARNRVGAYTAESFWRRGLSTHLLFYNKSSGVYLFYDQIAELFGSRVPDFADALAEFRQHIQSLPIATPNATADDYALAPCCSDLGRERMLRDPDWPRVLKSLFESAGRTPPRIHLLGGPGDRPHLDQLAALLRTHFPTIEFLNHAGELTLGQSVAQIGIVGKLICIDSGLLHFARLMGTPTVSYWGPTSPATLLKPVAGDRHEIHYVKISCSPCIHITNEAPCCGNNLCMRFAADPDCGLPTNPIWLVESPTPPVPPVD
jgi:ADP-heptose:LPS heptosyltransferase